MEQNRCLADSLPSISISLENEQEFSDLTCADFEFDSYLTRFLFVYRLADDERCRFECLENRRIEERLYRV